MRLRCCFQALSSVEAFATVVHVRVVGVGAVFVAGAVVAGAVVAGAVVAVVGEGSATKDTGLN